jgi:hypothetical protein
LGSYEFYHEQKHLKEISPQRKCANLQFATPLNKRKLQGLPKGVRFKNFYQVMDG